MIFSGITGTLDLVEGYIYIYIGNYYLDDVLLLHIIYSNLIYKIK